MTLLNEESVEHDIDVEDRFNVAFILTTIGLFGFAIVFTWMGSWAGVLILTPLIGYIGAKTVLCVTDSIGYHCDYRTLHMCDNPVITFNGKHAFCNGVMLKTIKKLDRCDRGFSWSVCANRLTVPYRCDFVTLYDLEE